MKKHNLGTPTQLPIELIGKSAALHARQEDRTSHNIEFDHTVILSTMLNYY